MKILRISDVIHKVNEQSITLSTLANEIGIAKDTLRRRLKSCGYSFNNKSKKYDYVGELNEKDEIDKTDISEVFKSKNIKKSDKNQIKSVEKNDFDLSDDEKKFVKKLYSHQNDIRLSIDLSMLPIRRKTKKHSIEISEQTYNEFEEFSSRMKEKRYTKNDLIEIALMRMIREFDK